MKKRLYRSRTDSVIAGVCGGVGEYLGVDSTLVRLVFVLAILTGMSLLVYPLLWIVMPRENLGDASTGELYSSATHEMAEQARNLGSAVSTGLRGSSRQSGVLMGAILVLVGLIFLLQNLDLYWLRSDLIWPLLLVVCGILLIQRRIGAARGGR
ncbi:MAG: PspC domain-containing protein [Sphingomonadaceae bacterium]